MRRVTCGVGMLSGPVVVVVVVVVVGRIVGSCCGSQSLGKEVVSL